MIIKITKSTSRISINGTTFMSETIPRLPPANIPIIHLVFGGSDRVGARVRSKMPLEEDYHIQRKQAEQAPPVLTQKNLLARFDLVSAQHNFVTARAPAHNDHPRDMH